MDQKIMDTFTNPVKCKIFMEVQKCKETNAKHLAETLSDVPQATLYRYLKKMTADGILKIVNETPIRGVIEKTYAIAMDMKKGFEEMIDQNSGEAYMQSFMQYMLGFAEQFQTYCGQDNIDIINDRSGFSLTHLYLTDEELEALVKKIGDTIKPFTENPSREDRNVRTIGLIVSPPQK